MCRRWWLVGWGAGAGICGVTSGLIQAHGAIRLTRQHDPGLVLIALETHGKTESETSGLNGVGGRLFHFIRTHSKVFSVLAIVVAWFGINYPGLGEMGLWDPWEMNRAQLARQMTEAPKVFVVESVASGKSLGSLGAWLAARYEDHLQIASLESPARPKSSARKAAQRVHTINLENALTRLDESIFHLLIVDVRAVVPDPRATNVVKTFADWLERVEARNPGLQRLIVVGAADSTASSMPSDDYKEALREAMVTARANLAANDLVGKGWGKAGAFRKALHIQLRAAKKNGYSPVHDRLLTPDEPVSFLEKGFWDAAKKHRLHADMKESVPSAIVDQLAEKPLFAFADPLVGWVSSEQYAALTKDFSAAPQEARRVVDTFEAEVDRVFGQPWTQARLKMDGETRSLPPFDSWLVARSLSWFGFSERSCRIPAFVLGMLGALLVFWIASRVWGGRVGLLSCLVLMTCPLYFAQGHSVSSEMSFMVSLILVVGGLLMLVHREDSVWSGVGLLFAGAALAFLTKGVFGLLLPAGIAGSYILITRETRLRVWGSAGVLGLLLGVAWLMVYSAAEGSFWSQFSLQNALFEWNINSGDRPVDLNFDVLIRQIGFGAAPWSALLPLAFGYLVMERTKDGHRPAVLIVLWFAIPYVVQSFLFKDTNHFVFPAIPALAVGVGLLLDRVLRGELLGVLGGTIAVVLLGILVSELKQSPEPLTSFLTVDPPLYGSEGKGNYPESLKLPKSLLLVLSMIAVVIIIHTTKLASKVRSILGVFLRPKGFWIALTAVLTLLVVRFVVGLETHIADLYAAGGPVRHLEPIHRLFVRSVLYWRPETWAVALIGIGGLLGLLACHTGFFQAKKRWIQNWVLTTPIFLISGFVLSVAGVSLALFGHSDPVASLTEDGKLALGIMGLLCGLATIVSAARRPDTTTMAGVVLTATAARLVAMPGALWLEAVGVSAQGPEYAIVEALVTTGLSVVLCVIGVSLIRHQANRVGRFAILCAALVVAIPAYEPTNILTLLAFVLGRVALMATVLAACRGPHIVAAFAERFPVCAHLTSPLAGWAAVVLAVVVGAVMLVPALTVDPLRSSPLASPLVWGALALTVLVLLSALSSGVGAIQQRLQSIGERCGQFGARLLGGIRAWQERPSWILTTVGIALLCLGIALERILAWGQFTDGYVSWATIHSPVAWIGGLLLAVLALGVWIARTPSLSSRLAPEGSTLHGVRYLSEPRMAWLVGGALLAWIVGGCAVQLFRGSGLTLMNYQALPDPSTPEAAVLLGRALLIGALVSVSGLMAVMACWPFIAKRRSFAIGFVIVSGLALAAILVIPLTRKWVQLEGAALPEHVEPYLTYVFAKSRVTLLLYGMVGVLLLLGVVGRFDWLSAQVRNKRRLIEVLTIVWVIGLVGSIARFGEIHPDGGLSVIPLAGALLLSVAAFFVVKSTGVVSLLSRLRRVVPSVILFGVFAAMGLVGWFLRDSSSVAALILMVGAGAGLLAVLTNVLARWIAPIRALELVERPRVFVILVALLAGSFAFLYNQQLVSALSYHVSQKHILETVRVAERDGDWTKRIYQIGIGKRSLVNFYTRDIPSVRKQDHTIALRALAGESDQVLPVTYAGQSVTEHRLIRAFSPNNDSDGDGKRDYPADAGMMASVNKTQGWMLDPDKHWQTDQWKGSLLIDSDDWAFKVLSNTENKVVFQRSGTRVKNRQAVKGGLRKTPRFDANVISRNRYVLDSPDASEHGASAMGRDRVYFLLPKIGQHAPAYSDSGSFSDLNHQFRKLSGGRQLVVLDDRSSRILLATQQLRDGEKDHNWIRDAVLSAQDFEAKVKAGDIRGADPKRPQAGIINWDNKLLLLGWSMDRYAVSKGQKLTIRLYFKAIKPVQKSLKIFMHIDRAGHRIHADHWVLPVKKGKEGKHCIGCFQTNHWLAGDIVVDTLERDVPIGAPGGTTDIWLGFFNPQGDKRLSVTQWNEKTVHYPGRDNRVRIGSFEVR